MREMRMPQIWTASWRAGLPDSATPIGISRGTPRRVAGYRRLRTLEPGEWFRSVAPARYLELYREVLERLDPAEIYDRLLSYGPSPILLCWESGADCHNGRAWCHRHLVTQWLEDRLGIEVPEVGHPELDRFALLRKSGIPTPDYRRSPGPNRITSDNASSRN
jgi:hypothetical protein